MFDVLIADDEQLARETVKILLGQCDDIDQVHETNNGKSALELILKHKPKIVMLDIEMPNLNGIEVAKQLPDDISVIFITAFSHFEEKMNSVKYAGYILKPFKDEEFFECLEKARIIQNNLSEQET
jgi:two-component system LytT family response regulator